MKRESGASVGSIVGFCRKLGVGGFADLKIALARELAGAWNNFNPGKVSVVEQVFRLHTKSLAETQTNQCRKHHAGGEHTPSCKHAGFIFFQRESRTLWLTPGTASSD